MAALWPNPYSIEAGPELDALIQHQVLKAPSAHANPCYSTDSKAADSLRYIIESQYKNRFVTGTTNTYTRTWFARYEVQPGNPTEVLAETYPLAICRLALLRVMEGDEGCHL